MMSIWVIVFTTYSVGSHHTIYGMARGPKDALRKAAKLLREHRSPKVIEVRRLGTRSF